MLPRWLAAIDVGLVLYRPGPGDNGSPLRLYDYMASGLAVVCTTQLQVREMLDQLGQLDLLVPRDNASALANVLSQPAADRDRVRRQGNAGRRLVIDFYNWRRAVRDTMNEVEVILKEQR
jgi:glycosyltransferase involved in cell wall biosynthesis